MREVMVVFGFFSPWILFFLKEFLVLFLQHCCGSIQDDCYRKEKLSPLCCLSHSRGLNSWQQTWVNGSNIIFSCEFSCSICTVSILLHFLHYITLHSCTDTTSWRRLFFFRWLKAVGFVQRQSNWQLVSDHSDGRKL